MRPEKDQFQQVLRLKDGGALKEMAGSTKALYAVRWEKDMIYIPFNGPWVAG